MTSKWIAISAVVLGVLGGCSPEGVGDPCLPEQVPCDDKAGGGKDLAKCGFKSNESFVESSSVQCRTRTCIVHKLSKTGGPQLGGLSDPRDVCKTKDAPPQGWEVDNNGSRTTSDTDSANCVESKGLESSVYCTCRCRDGDGKKIEGCDCSEFPGFECVEILTLGGDGIRGSYCVRPKADDK